MSYNRQKVATALALLEEVASTLNSNSETCSCCGHKVHQDWPQKQVADTLEGSIQKLHRLLGAHDDRLEKRAPPKQEGSV